MNRSPCVSHLGWNRLATVLLALSPLLAQAGAQCDGTVVPGQGFIRAGGIYKIQKGGTTYLCVACGSCRAMPPGSGSSAGSSTSTRSMIGGAVLGGFLSGLQQGTANAQAEREREAARREAERIEAERRDAEQRRQFEQTKAQTLGALKGFSSPGDGPGLALKPATTPPPDSRAQDEARCAAERSGAARGVTSADRARDLSAQAMQGASDCPALADDLPAPSSERQLSPEDAARVQAAEALVLQLSRNGTQWSEAYARHMAAQQELRQMREQIRAAQQQPQDAEAQRKAQAALAAAARLEQELAELERTMQGIEQSNQQLIKRLGDAQSGTQGSAGPASNPNLSSDGNTK